MAPKGVATPRRRAAAKPTVTPGRSPLPIGRGRSPSGASSPRAFTTELSLPIDPEIEKGHVQAIIQSFDRAQRADTINLPSGVDCWQDLPPNSSPYASAEEIDELRSNTLVSRCNFHDFTEPCKAIATNIISASKMLNKNVIVNGRKGTIQGMRMGTLTLQIYYIVEYPDNAIQYFQNFEIMKYLVEGHSAPAKKKTVSAMKAAPAPTAKKKTVSAMKAVPAPKKVQKVQKKSGRK